MSEKVLGFKEKNAAINTEFYRGVKYCPAYLIEISKLVPVVSVEWLEKECKKQIKKSRTPFADEFTLKHLLDAVRLQAVEEKE